MPHFALAGRVKTFDVAIVGRGIAGLSLATEILRRTEKSVAIVGPRHHAEGSATLAAQGISSIKGLVLARDPLFAAKLAGHRALLDWIGALTKESGVPVGLDRGGVGELSQDIGDFRELVGRAYQRRFQGVFCPREGRFVGRFRGKSAYGLLHPGDLWFDPQDALNAMEAMLRKAQQRVAFFDKTVKSFEDNTQAGKLITRFDGDEKIQAERVIVAAGFATPGLLTTGLPKVGWREVGGETFVSTPLPSGPLDFRPIGRDPPGNGVASPVSSFVRGTSSVTIRPNGTIILGSTTGDSPGDVKVYPLNTMAYEIGLLAGSDAFDPASYRSRWGLRLRSKDRAPVCGAVPGHEGRLWAFSGFYKNGLQLAPLLAPMVAEAIAFADESRIPFQFSTRRFGS